MIDNKVVEQIKNRKSIMLANYTPSAVATQSKEKGYRFDPAFEGEPSREFVTFDELYDINMKTRAIKTGLLVIEDPDADLIYEILGVQRDKVLTEEAIEKMATDTSIENQKRIIEIAEVSTIERLRACYVHLVNERDERASFVIGDIINRRYREIINNKRQSAIVVDKVPPAATSGADNKELELIKKELEEYKQSNAEMMAMIKAFMESKKGETREAKHTTNKKPKK